MTYALCLVALLCQEKTQDSLPASRKMLAEQKAAEGKWERHKPGLEWMKSRNLGDASVAVVWASVSRVQLKVKGKEDEVSENPLLCIVVKLQSTNPKKVIHYKGWSVDPEGDSDFPAFLRDNNQNRFQRSGFDGAKPVHQIDGYASVRPDKPTYDVLVFEAPIPTSKELRLTLAGNRLKERGVIEIRIPVDDLIVAKGSDFRDGGYAITLFERDRMLKELESSIKELERLQGRKKKTE